MRSAAQVIFCLVLFLSGLLTFVLGVRTLVDPAGMMQTFGIAESLDGLDLLIAVLGGALISLALFVSLAAWWSWHGRKEGRTLGLLAAATLLLVALCGWTIGGSTAVLALDGVRGLLLLVTGLLWQPRTSSETG